MSRKKVFRFIFSSVCAVAMLGCICCSHMDATSDDVTDNGDQKAVDTAQAAPQSDSTDVSADQASDSKATDDGQVAKPGDEIAQAMDQSGDAKSDDLDSLGDGGKADSSKSADLTATAAAKTDGSASTASPPPISTQDTAAKAAPPILTADDESGTNGGAASTDTTADNSSATSDVKASGEIAQTPTPDPEATEPAEPPNAVAKVTNSEPAKPHKRVVAHHSWHAKHHHKLAQAEVKRDVASNVAPSQPSNNIQVATAPLVPSPVNNRMGQLRQPAIGGQLQTPNPNQKMLAPTPTTVAQNPVPSTVPEKALTAKEMMMGNKKLDDDLDSEGKNHEMPKRTLASAEDITDMLQHNLWMVFVGAAGLLMIMLLVSRRVRRSRDHDLLD